MDAITILLKQFYRNLEKQPGWVPLLALIYLLAILVPADARIFGICLVAHREFFVVLATFLLYQLGDSFDKAIYARYVEPFWDWAAPQLKQRPRCRAQKVLGIQGGEYKVSKSLLESAGAYEGTRIQLYNELAKFFRSLVLPLCLVPLVTFWVRVPCPAAFPVAGIVILLFYSILKPRHIGMLYAKIVELIQDGGQTKYKAHDLSSEIRLFFWEGALIGTATPRGKPKPPCLP